VPDADYLKRGRLGSIDDEVRPDRPQSKFYRGEFFVSVAHVGTGGKKRHRLVEPFRKTLGCGRVSVLNADVLDD
jgi:hypothetical protein